MYQANPLISDKSGHSPLHWASYFGMASTVEALLNAGVDINVRNNSEETALHWAAENGQMKSLKLLLKRGARLHVYDGRGETPFHKAVMMNHLKCVALFLEAGESVHHPTKSGELPLEISGDMSVGSLLMQEGAEVTESGWGFVLHKVSVALSPLLSYIGYVLVFILLVCLFTLSAEEP